VQTLALEEDDMPGPGLDLIGEEEIAEVLEVLRSGYLARYGPDDDPRFGAKVRRLEEAVAAWTGVDHAVGMNSGTSALLAILAALGIGPGDEVIVPGFTYVASISSIVYARAVPVLAEVDETLNLDPVDVEARITPRTRAILVVHMLGNPARMEEIRAVADRHGIALIEDCAQAFGASYRGHKVGSIGAAGAVSFNVFKTITSGDGGMAVTDDAELYRRLFAFHDQGHLPLRNGVEVGGRSMLGLNFRMTELSGAVLLAQMRRLETILGTLRENKARLKGLIAEQAGISFRVLPDPDGDIATHLVVLFPTAEAARDVSRELGSRVLADSGWHIYTQMEHLLAQRTAVGRGCPFDCRQFYPEPIEYRAGMLPRTEAIVGRAMSIGIGVADPNLGSTFGITIRDDEARLEAVADRFLTAASRHLG
jgi:dTDP-4-amino-4,6-dideoxygalactose transaminase